MRKVMPKNKRPNRKPSRAKARQRTATEKLQKNFSGAKGARPETKTFGPKPSRSHLSPVMNRGSARNR